MHLHRTAAVSLLLLHLFSAVNSDLSADTAALLSLRSSLGGRTRLWNLSQPDPCSWAGVRCRSGRVTELRLPGYSLTGQIPANTIGNLTELITLSLRFNALSGSIPSDISSLVSLRNLYLQGNRFTGVIPVSIFSLHNLVRLNLASNRLSGPISGDFNKLNRLGTLYLEKNELTGSIPDLNLPALVQFNVSFNKLTGIVPERLSGKPGTAFIGNAALCGRPIRACNETIFDEGGKRKLSGGVIAGIVIGVVVGVLLVLLVLFFVCRRRGGNVGGDVFGKRAEVVGSSREKSVQNVGDGSVNGNVSVKDKGKEEGNVGKKLVFFGDVERGFDLEELLRASADVLGKGTFGTTYKAILETGMTVAVKRLKEVAVSEKEFKARTEVVGRMDHENLVHLRAYYYGRDEKLFIYNFMPIGSLSALLHGSKGAGRASLIWETRLSIALGAARGIAYIHSQGSGVSHGNIKSSNILLTASFEARVSDFGLSPLVRPSPSLNQVTGYRAPEVTDAHKVSQKADVYSFGVLLLELITGKSPTHALFNEEGVDLPRWVQSIVKDEWAAVVFDVELIKYQNVEGHMVQLLQLAVECTSQHPNKRPSMAEVTHRIEDIRIACSKQDQETSQGNIVD